MAQGTSQMRAYAAWLAAIALVAALDLAAAALAFWLWVW